MKKCITCNIDNNSGYAKFCSIECCEYYEKYSKTDNGIILFRSGKKVRLGRIPGKNMIGWLYVPFPDHQHEEWYEGTIKDLCERVNEWVSLNS